MRFPCFPSLSWFTAMISLQEHIEQVAVFNLSLKVAFLHGGAQGTKLGTTDKQI